MNLSEFKAWFEGFTESMDGPPGEKAWKRITDRIKSIKSDEPTTKHVFREYYERPWHRWYDRVSCSGAMPSGGLQGGTMNFSHASQLLACNSSAPSRSVDAETFDPRTAFNRLGKAEALSLAK